MENEGQVTLRYSHAFKQKVVSEIESGKLTLAQARSVYDICGTYTIQTWIKKLGRNHLLGKVVRIEMKDETDRIRNLEAEKKKLESALAQTQLKVLALEELLDVAEEHYGIDIKKNSGGKLLRDCGKRSNAD